MLTADELRADIKAQMQSRVRWTESVQLMQMNGIQAYVEAGSGEVLLGMIKRIDPNALSNSVGKSHWGTPKISSHLKDINRLYFQYD